MYELLMCVESSFIFRFYGEKVLLMLAQLISALSSVHESAFYFKFYHGDQINPKYYTMFPIMNKPHMCK